ncbi:MAG: two component transcriptional regulator, LuxR family [Candidatus Acidoferrum typicum]|nr:two component transcriptional regulator, LuxR family [Candidatus Acidoferrum typicum]
MTDIPAVKETARPKGSAPDSRRRASKPARPDTRKTTGEKIRVFIAAENRLLREALARVLTKGIGIDVIATDSAAFFHTDAVLDARPNVLLLNSRGSLEEDLSAIQEIRTAAPAVRILLIGMAKDEREFLKCVRAGISGYLLRDASASEVLQGVQAVSAGEAVCPGALCAALFRYFESEATGLPCTSSKRRMGLSRRELQLIPLIAQGLTNKEIANHFSLSEQTVKNHLYRMKHKIGAEDRLEMVQLYRTQGFLV